MRTVARREVVLPSLVQSASSLDGQQEQQRRRLAEAQCSHEVLSLSAEAHYSKVLSPSVDGHSCVSYHRASVCDRGSVSGGSATVCDRGDRGNGFFDVLDRRRWLSRFGIAVPREHLLLLGCAALLACSSDVGL